MTIHEGFADAEVGAVHTLEFSAERGSIVGGTIGALTRLQDERRFVREIQGLQIAALIQSVRLLSVVMLLVIH